MFVPSRDLTKEATLRRPKGLITSVFVLSFVALATLPAHAQTQLSADLTDKIDKVATDTLARTIEVTIRQLLSHPSGYQDYWPQDYVMPGMLQPTNAQQIMDAWARKPLDFDPGAKWQYSNTNYVIAGVIVEKVARMPLLQFLQQKVFAPLGIKSAFNTDEGPLGENDSRGYLRYALGPLRPASKEGKGWLFAAGELAMTAEGLGKSDGPTIDHEKMKTASTPPVETDLLV